MAVFLAKTFAMQTSRICTSPNQCRLVTGARRLELHPNVGNSSVIISPAEDTRYQKRFRSLPVTGAARTMVVIDRQRMTCY